MCVASIGDDGESRLEIAQLLGDRSRMLLPHCFVPEHLYRDTISDPVGVVEELIRDVVGLVVGKISQLQDILEAIRAFTLGTPEISP